MYFEVNYLLLKGVDVVAHINDLSNTIIAMYWRFPAQLTTVLEISDRTLYVLDYVLHYLYYLVIFVVILKIYSIVVIKDKYML